MDKLAFADINLTFSDYSLGSGEKCVHLGFKEFEIMKILMSNAKRIVLKDDLICKVWGMDSDAEDNNVEAYISFLRKKLAFIGSKVTIATVRKVGYILESGNV